MSKLTENDQKILLNVYSKNIESIYDDGLAYAAPGHALLRAVKLSHREAEGADGKKIILDHAGANQVNDVRRGLAYEVMSVGEDCFDALQEGMHCRYISAAAMPTYADGSGDYVRVHHEDITEYWWPSDVVERYRGTEMDPEIMRLRSVGLA